MANDKPTNLRMGFGYGQARAAGLEGILSPRSPRQINKIVRSAKAERSAINDLRIAAQDPDWKPYLEHRTAQGCSAKVIADELYWMERYWRMRRRFSIAWCLKHHWRSQISN